MDVGALSKERYSIYSCKRIYFMKNQLVAEMSSGFGKSLAQPARLNFAALTYCHARSQ